MQTPVRASMRLCALLLTAAVLWSAKGNFHAFAQDQAKNNPQAGSSAGAHATDAPTKNRSEIADGQLVVHVLSVTSSEKPLTFPTGAFQLGATGPDPQYRTAKPKEGATFLTITFRTDSKADDYTISEDAVELIDANGKHSYPLLLKFSGRPAIAMFGSIVPGETVGGKGHPANDQFDAVFGVPKAGLGKFLFSVSGTEVGTLKELNPRLFAAPVRAPTKK